MAEMLAAALEEGMLTLKMDGMEKVLQGVTDMAAGPGGLHQVTTRADIESGRSPMPCGDPP